MKNIEIRPAAPGDEEQIARVHIQAWQETYKGLLDQRYIDELPNKLEKRAQSWSQTLAKPDRWIWVATTSNALTGFVLFGPPRDPDRDGFVELGAIYLLAESKGQGVGRALLATGFAAMRERGYEKAYCWVLENNPTIGFYEHTGAVLGSATKLDTIAGEQVKELVYEWHTLDLDLTR